MTGALRVRPSPKASTVSRAFCASTVPGFETGSPGTSTRDAPTIEKRGVGPRVDSGSVGIDPPRPLQDESPESRAQPLGSDLKVERIRLRQGAEQISGTVTRGPTSHQDFEGTRAPEASYCPVDLEGGKTRSVVHLLVREGDSRVL